MANAVLIPKLVTGRRKRDPRGDKARRVGWPRLRTTLDNCGLCAI
jgi:hypothetical protein